MGCVIRKIARRSGGVIDTSNGHERGVFTPYALTEGIVKSHCTMLCIELVVVVNSCPRGDARR